MAKTTLYLPDDLKKAIEYEACRSSTSEAEVMRRALRAALSGQMPNSIAAFRRDSLLRSTSDMPIGLTHASNIVLAQAYKSSVIATLDRTSQHFDLLTVRRWILFRSGRDQLLAQGLWALRCTNRLPILL